MSAAGFQSFLQAAFAWAWSNSLAATVLIAVVLLVRWLLRGRLPEKWQYALGLLVVIRLVLPTAPPSAISLFNLGLQFSPDNARGVLLPDQSQHQSGFRQSAEASPPVAAAGSSAHATQSLIPEAAGSTKTSAHRDTRQSLLVIAARLWLLGAAAYIGVVLVAHRRLSRSLRGLPTTTDEGIASLLEQGRIALGLKREVRVVESAHTHTPAIFGFVRPRLLLPCGLSRQLTGDQLRLVILHELVHVKRRDVLQNWLLIAVQALHWFNPAVWLALRRLRADRELVCDAAVMQLLNPPERCVYGNMLIQLAEKLPHATRSPLAPGLVPILCHKPEIERRITMIAKYKPTRRFVTVASATLTCIILALTFTRAADPAPKAKPAETSASTEVSEQAKRQRTIRVLEREVRKLDDQIASKQKEMDALKMELGISDVEAAIGPGGTIEPETLRKLEGLRIEAKADYTRSDTFYRYLTNLSRAELRKAIATASPDQQLIQLLGQFHTSEQKMAAMLENQGTEHPEVRAGRRLLEQVTKQIEERLDGILKGLEAKTQADKARLVDLQKEVDRYKHYDIEQAIKRRPYYQAKRDLENLQLLRERLQARLFQERIDAAIETEQ